MGGVDKLIFKRLYAPVALDAQSGRMLLNTMHIAAHVPTSSRQAA